MSVDQWISLGAAIVAALAAIASWRVAYITKKQYEIQSDERIKKYRPFFKIKNYHETSQNAYWFDIVNEGYPFYAVVNVKWVGNHVIVKRQFNALMVHKHTKGNVQTETDRYENLTVSIQVEENVDTEGFFEVVGFDIENNDFSFKSPRIIIKEGKIKNGIDLTYQYLR